VNISGSIGHRQTMSNVYKKLGRFSQHHDTS
jgi:hypothetical protein